MARIMHIADLHLGCRQYGMQEREEDFYRALGRVGEIAVERKVDAVVIAGDVFDSPKPPARAVLELAGFVSKLKSHHGIDVLGIEGNHDSTRESYWLRVCGIWPLGLSPYVNSMNGIRVAGFNYCRAEELLQAIESFEGSGFPGPWPVVVLHCGVAEMNAGFAPDVSAAQLAPLLQKLGCRYVALGHIHIPCEQVHDGIMFAQPGSLEMKSLDEPKSKFVEIVDLDENGFVEHAEQVGYGTRQVVFMDVHDEESLEKAVSEMRGKGGPNSPLFVAYVDRTVRDGVSRIADAMKSAGVLGRALPVGEKEAARTYDRKESMNLLKDAVSAFFDEGDPRHSMVLDIIATGNPRLVVERFMNGEKTETANTTAA